MADETGTDPNTQAAPEGKKGKRGLLIGAVLALVLGAGGFGAVYTGLLPGSVSMGGGGHGAAGHGGPVDHTVTDTLHPVTFVPLEPLVISIGQGAGTRHLRFRAELEVEPGTETSVSQLTPRVMDVLNSYLRAVGLSDLEDPAALIGLRAQMLRRVQLVTGEGRVRDLLIMEFVLS